MDKLSYMGGLLDGEGNIDASTYKRGNATIYQCRIRIGMHDAEGVLMLHEAFGGSYRTRPAQSCIHHIVEWSNKQAVEMAVQLAPYTIIKRSQLLKLAEWPCPGRGVRNDIDIILKKREIVEALREMKTAGWTMLEDADHG